MRIGVTLAVLLLAAVPALGAAVVLKPALDAEAGEGRNLVENPGLEDVREGEVVGAGAWQAGYEIDDRVHRGGRRSARASADDPEVQHGIFFEMALNQERAAPVVAEVWSRAEDVSGTPTGGYSLWVDIEFMDGSNLWGQNAPFECGTHDWQQRTLPIAPIKPIRTLLVYGLFRGKTGTAWFDDFRVVELTMPEGVSTFNGVPVRLQRPALEAPEPLALSAGALTLRLDAKTGALVAGDGAASGIFWRDVAAGSDFRQPRAGVQREGGDALLAARDEELGLELEARFSPRGDRIAVSGRVRDLRGEDRAISLYLAIPVDAVGGVWWDDQRASREIEPGMTYQNVTSCGAGPNAMASRYPLACVTTQEAGAVVAIPLDAPVIAELAYDAASRELYAAMHLGLAPEPERFPSSAEFALEVYPVDPEWGFRDALRRYYALHPERFTKRSDREGIWMPFTDVSTVQGWEDFGFAFHEGNNNVAFDDEAGIYSFVYCEPNGYWLHMPPEMPREREEAVKLLRQRGEEGHEADTAALTSAAYDPAGRMILHLRKAPWCDGALFILNPSPHLMADQPDQLTRARFVGRQVWRAFEHAAKLAGWGPYGAYELAPGAGRGGSAAIRAEAREPGPHGAAQTISIDQQEPRALLVSGWSRAQRLDGDPGNEWCLYVDITYADGDHLWGQRAAFDAGTEGWQGAEVRIEPAKPVATAAVYAMFRGEVTGSVLFDDLEVREEGSDENLLRNPGFEPQEPGELDGIYIDSSEMGATTPNFRREHWRDAAAPLTFTRDGSVCQLTIFNAVEFARGLAEQLHQQGRLLMANSTPARFPWLAAWCDVMGIETNWNPGGEYSPMSSAALSYRRAMCYQRPYLLLQNTIYAEFPPELVERYFKRSVAWGIFPSFFSHNAADDPYWRRPALYNRDREVFLKYIPVCARLSEAGWEPVTHARSSDARVNVERFGPGDEGDVYLTAFNDSDEAVAATVTVDAAALDLQSPRLTEVLTGEGLELAGDGTFEVRLEADGLTVVGLSEGR
ncbi:MAG: hypothetical protein U9R79_11320 [Armatimonadota bacterium]|nr:hypothetical protein [Armatimonadota bacterium]